VGFADNAAGGQNNSPIVKNTINSEPTNIDTQLTTIGQRQPVGRCHEWRRPAACCGAQMQNVSYEINEMRSANGL